MEVVDKFASWPHRFDFTDRILTLGLVAGCLLFLGLVMDVLLLVRERRRRVELSARWHRLASRPWPWTEAFRIGFLLYAVTVILSRGLASLIGARPNPNGPSLNAAELTSIFLKLLTLTQLIGFHGGILALVTARVRARRLSWEEAFGVSPSSIVASIIPGLAWYLAVLPPLLLTSLTYRVLLAGIGCEVEPQVVVEIFASPETSRTLKWLLGGASVSVAPLAEEIFFRGVLFPCLLRYVRPSLAVLGVSVLFAALHANLGAALPLLILSVALCWAYRDSGSILAPVILHAAFNGANLLAMLWAPELTGVG